MKREIRDQEIADMIARGGFTLQEVADMWGLSKQRVHQIALQHGVTKRSGYATQRRQLRDLAIAEYAWTHTDAETGAEFGLQPQTVARKRRRHGIRHRRRNGDFHGTANGYSRYGCRCDACRGAMREGKAQMKGREPPRHGASGYTNYGCRCVVCTEGNRLKNIQYRAARRARGE